MKICVVPTMFPKYKGDYYGSFVYDEAHILIKKGFEVHVVTQHNAGIPYETIMDEIHVHRFRWMEPKKFKALLHFKGFIDNLRLITYLISLFFKLIRTISKYDIDVVHAHSIIPMGFVGVLVAKIMRKPVFITSHGMDVTSFEDKKLFKMLIKFSLNNCNYVLAVSEDLAVKIKPLDNQNNITVLRNGVDTNRFRPEKNTSIRRCYGVKDHEIVVIFVGYLDVFKGVFDLVNAFKNVKNVNKKLMMVGDGPKMDELRNMVSDYHLDESVIFTGNVPSSDIQRYYQSADIFVIPSHVDSGGPPLVVMEAMACGLPVIGTNIGGIPEGIENSVNGFIVPDSNVDELTNKIEILMEDKDLRTEFGENSLTKVYENSMTLEKKSERLIELYEKTINNP